MKKTFLALGYLFLALLVVVAAVVGVLAVAGNRLDRESKAFVDAAVPAIVAHWDIDEIQKRASPEFDADVNYDDLAQDLDELRQMGKLVEYKGSTGESNITISFQWGYEITADYTATADFESAQADIRISLIRHNGEWQILDIQVNPEEFSESHNVI